MSSPEHSTFSWWVLNIQMLYEFMNGVKVSAKKKQGLQDGLMICFSLFLTWLAENGHSIKNTEHVKRTNLILNSWERWWVEFGLGWQLEIWDWNLGRGHGWSFRRGWERRGELARHSKWSVLNSLVWTRLQKAGGRREEEGRCRSLGKAYTWEEREGRKPSREKKK